MTGVVIDPHLAQCLRDNEPTEPADCLAALVQRRAECDELRAEVARLREALAFYADESTYETQYERLPCDCCTDIYEPINDDKGTIARAALTDGGGE